jgi:hypothetical protein
MAYRQATCPHASTCRPCPHRQTRIGRHCNSRPIICGCQKKSDGDFDASYNSMVASTRRAILEAAPLHKSPIECTDDRPKSHEVICRTHSPIDTAITHPASLHCDVYMDKGNETPPLT